MKHLQFGDLVVGQVRNSSALTGGEAITVDNDYLFALRKERKLKEEDPFWFGVARYVMRLSAAARLQERPAAKKNGLRHGDTSR